MTHPAAARPQRLVAALLSLAIVLAALAPSITLPAPFARAQDEPVPSGDVIVVLEEDATRAEVRAEAAEEGVQTEEIFTEVIDAFTAEVTPAEAEALAADPDVAGVFPNLPVYAAEQSLPTGVDRIDADEHGGADIDGGGPVVDVDVAVLDSGIDASHPDLNVQEDSGVNCQDTGDELIDDTGHGTHVAGIVGAYDNDRDTVGVAPGARLHSVRVLKRTTRSPAGAGSIDNLICGLEWVVLNANVIDVVNMSIVGTVDPEEDTGTCSGSPIHRALCNTVAAGVPVVVAAGNSSVDVSSSFPATYDEVIAVSAFSDLDGAYGGRSTTACGTHQDDTFASYSNFGPDVDIAAPGSCIRSSQLGGGVTSKSGTSMAAPHVTGAAALYLAENPGASPAGVRSWLLTTASQPQNSRVGFTGDRDGRREPVLWLGDGDQPTMTPTKTPTRTATPTGTPLPTSPYPLSGGGRSVNSASYTYVRDRDLDTSWRTKRFSSGPPASAYVYVDLGGPKPIGAIRWVFGEYGYADLFRVQVSSDLATWTQVTQRNGKPAGEWVEKQLATPVTARYVRFLFENPRGDLYLGGLAEVQVWAPGEAPALPTATPTRTPTPVLGGGGTYAIVASTQSSNALDAGLAYDGSEATSWRTSYGIPTPASAEARFQISSVQPIGIVSWVFGVGGRADAYTVQISDDGEFWEDVFSGGNAPSGVWQNLELPPDVTGKFVRFSFENPNGDAVLASLAEVEILPPVAGGSRPAATTVAPTGTPTAATVTPETPTATTGTREVTGTPTAPPTVASPVAQGETETPGPIESPVAGPSTPTPDPSAPSATRTVGAETPAATATERAPGTVGSNASGEAAPASTSAPVVPTATAAAPGAIPSPTTENPEPNTETVPVVGVRRTTNAANGWTALDGDPATVWRTTVVPPGRLAILTLDLGAPVAVGTLRLLVAEDGFAGALTVEVSDDLATWTAVVAPSAADLPAGAWATLPFDAPAQTRYVRLVVVNPGPLATLAGAAEVELLPSA